MLTGSYVIKVDHVDPWVNFYSYLFKPGENYFQIKITNYKDEKLNFKENKKVYNEIVKIYEKTKNNKTLFNKMSQNNKKIVRQLNSKFITKYLKYLLMEYYDNFVE